MLKTFNFGVFCDAIEPPARKEPAREIRLMTLLANALSTQIPAPKDGPKQHPHAEQGVLFVSVVVPVRNEAKFIERTLSQLVAQQYPCDQFEILVVDGQSTDGTPELVAKFAERYSSVRLFTNPRRLSSAARNVGIRNARGDVVVIVDGHSQIEDDRYLAKLTEAFQRSGADCVGRPQPLDIEGASTLQRAIAAARSSRLGHHPDSYIYSNQEGFVPAKSVAVAYRRAVFDRVGYFDENFDACEDVELNHRIDQAGLRCFFTPGVAVRYTPRATLAGLFRQLIRYGRGRVRLLRKHPETFSIGSFLPALFVLGCVAGPCLLWLSSWLAVAYFGTLALYGGIVVAVSVAIALRHNNGLLFPWLVVVFTVVHAASGAGVLLEALSGDTQRNTRRATAPGNDDSQGNAPLR